MKKQDIITAAAAVIKTNNCKSCKDVSKVWTAIVAEYGDDATRVRDAAKDLIKAFKAKTTDDARKVTDALKDGDRVARAAWADILKDRTINRFAIKVYNACDNDIQKVVDKFASYRTTDGRACTRHASKTEDGEIVVYYRVFTFDGARVATALSMLRRAVNNAKTAAISGTHKYTAVAAIEE